MFIKLWQATNRKV